MSRADHPEYANYILIENLSKLLFNSKFESDYNKWKQISVEDINNAATSLYNTSEKTLKKEWKELGDAIED